MAERKPRLRISLRTKLLVAALSVLAVPWAGYQYVRETETFLRQGQESAQLATARAVATVLHERPVLFQRRADLVRAVRDGRDLYARNLPTPIQLDGYADDWAPYLDWGHDYGADQVLEGRERYRPESLRFHHVIGVRDHYLYALFQVHDERIVYRAPNGLRLDQSDHLRIALEDAEGQFQRYLLTTSAPGWVNAHRMPSDRRDPLPEAPEVRIKGEWQETEDGYTLEIRIPLSMLGQKLAFAIGDVDDPQSRDLVSVVGTAGTRRLADLGAVLSPSPEIEHIVSGLERSGARIWVLDRQRTVLALAGELQDSGGPPAPRSLWEGLLHTLYSLILKQPATDFSDEHAAASRLDGAEIEAALAGRPAARWRPTKDKRTVILTSAYPVWAQNSVIGAVVVEQTANAILSLQNRAVERLFTVSIAVFGAVIVLLLAFASRLSGRIRRLRNQTETAIAPDGRVAAGFTPSSAGDEVGDLSRGFADLLERLGQYTRYLENMASQLSHELRTPLAVVKSSLENLELENLPSGAGTYTQRAKEGVERLNALLTSMSEATRLEQTLQRSEKELFDLRQVVGGCVEGYRAAYPGKTFELIVPGQATPIHGAPELIAQLLDKLVANAVDFATGQTPIQLRIAPGDKLTRLSVSNQGPPLPEEMQQRLFESMVSVRSNRGDTPHLGLGLYIVRLIAEFHGGRGSAKNRTDASGAEFIVELPSRQ